MLTSDVARGPPRLVYLAQRIPGNRLIQVAFEWEAPWPTKYVIECHEGTLVIARSDRLDWATVFEFLLAEYRRVGGNLASWYELVVKRLRAEAGGDST